MEHSFTGQNTDTYSNNGKIWEIARRFNRDSEKHIFDRFGNQLTKVITNQKGLPEVVAAYARGEMLSRQLPKNKTLNVCRRKSDGKDYQPCIL